MIVGISSASDAIREFILDCSGKEKILIGGEPGVGKFFVAKEIVRYAKSSFRTADSIIEVKSINDSLFAMISKEEPLILVVEEKKSFDLLKDKMDDSLWIYPLRERIEDIPILIDHFASKSNNPEIWHNKKMMQTLLNYWWPFNTAELKRVVTTDDGLSLLPFANKRVKMIMSQYSATEIISMKMDSFWNDLGKDNDPGKFYHLFLDSIEKAFINSALKKCNDSVKETAELLHIHRNTLSKKIKKLGIADEY